MENKKIITFKESYRGEAYVAFAENKTETYIFEKFLSWVSTYAHSSFANYFFLNKDNQAKILQDLKDILSSTVSSKFFQYGSDEYNLNVGLCFYREATILPSNLHRGSKSNSITVELEVDIPSLHDDNILHEDLANVHFSMIITNIEDVRYLEDY